MRCLISLALLCSVVVYVVDAGASAEYKPAKSKVKELKKGCKSALKEYSNEFCTGLGRAISGDTNVADCKAAKKAVKATKDKAKKKAFKTQTKAFKKSEEANFGLKWAKAQCKAWFKTAKATLKQIKSDGTIPVPTSDPQFEDLLLNGGEALGEAQASAAP